MPNPFYQAYALAALAVSAEPIYVPATASNGFPARLCALPHDLLDRTALAYICSPANPQGAVASRDYWRDLIALAEKHDFQILSDECYSEIYRDMAALWRVAGREANFACQPRTHRRFQFTVQTFVPARASLGFCRGWTRKH